jgi:hypothetical protein
LVTPTRRRGIERRGEERRGEERRGEERRLDYQAKTSGRIYRAIWPRQVNLNRKEVTPERTRWKNEKPS